MAQTQIYDAVLRFKSERITGGSSGFGLEIVKALVRYGADVAAFSSNILPLKEEEFLHAGAFEKARFLNKDIMRQESAQEIVSETVSAFGKLDFVIVNAGFAPSGSRNRSWKCRQTRS